MITAQLHTEAASSSSSTPLTTMSACRNSVTIDSEVPGSFINTPIRSSKMLGQPGENRAPRPELRRPDPDPGAVADLVYLVQQIDHIKAGFETLPPAGIDLLDDAEIDLLVARQAAAVREVGRG